MAVGEILAKGLVVIKGDTSHARAEISKLSAEEQKAAKARVKAQEEHNASLERSNQRFQLYAAGAVAGWAIISKSVKTYEEHLKSLGASGESELKRLQGATRALDGAQKNLEIAIGKVAAAAAPAALALADMANELANIVSGVGDVVRAAGNLPGGGYIGKGLGYVMKYGGPVNQGRALGSLAVTGIGNVIDNIRGTASGPPANYSSIDGDSDAAEWLNTQDMRAGWSRLVGKTSDTQSLLGDEGKRAIQYVDLEATRLITRTLVGKAQRFYASAKRDLTESGGKSGPRGGADPSDHFYSNLAARAGYGIQRWGTSITADQERESAAQRSRFREDQTYQSIGDYAGIASRQSGELAALIKELEGEEGAARGKTERDKMEEIFGPLRTFDQYAEGFTLVSDAATAAFTAIVTGSESAGAAIRKSIGAGILALGKDMLIRSLQEGAWAISDIAKGNLPGAAMHAKAGAAFLAGSVAAGGLAIGLGAGGGSGSGASGGYAAAGIGGGAANANQSQPMGLTVVMGDGMSDDSPRHRARRVRQAINRARGLYPESGAVEYG